MIREWLDSYKPYDMGWYIRKGVTLNLRHFALRAKDSGDWDRDKITESELRDLLAKKIDAVNMQYVRDYIKRFIKDQNGLEIWSPKYFHDLTSHLKVNE